MEHSEPQAKSRQSNVVEMFRPFDPLGADAEAHYDAVVRRLNRVRARKARLRSELSKLETPFVGTSDSDARDGSRGESLSSQGRRRRLDFWTE